MRDIEMADYINQMTCEPYLIRAYVDSYHSMIEVRIIRLVNDSCTESKELNTLIMPVSLISCCYTKETICAKILDCLEAAAIHEIREWFTIEGNRPFNPHKANVA